MKRFICLMMALMLLLPTTVAIKASSSETNYSGNNIDAQSYSRYSSPIYSYLEVVDNGFMKVQYVSQAKKIVVSYYDRTFNFKSEKVIPNELALFGGFYSDSKNYYIVSGQANPNEDNNLEVFRITKYDLNWNKVKSCELKGANTTIPFDAGSCRMDANGKWLFVRSAHEMYQSDDGLNHQANVMIQVNTETMTITDSFTGVMNIGYGYVSHSFNQFVKIDDEIITVDHGDAYPRSVVLIKHPNTYQDGTYEIGDYTNVITIPGAIGQNATGLSVGGLETSSKAYLIAGNSVIQDAQNLSRTTRNVYIASVNKESLETSITWLTNYSEGLEGVSTPQLVKIDDQRFMVLWTRSNHVYYQMINEDGKVSSNIYCLKNAGLSDCVPIVSENNVIWYTWNNNKITFYQVNINDLTSAYSKKIEDGLVSEQNYCSDGKHVAMKMSAKNPTCIEPGEKEHIGCSKCGTYLKDMTSNEELDASLVQTSPLGHDFSNGKVVNGIFTGTCSRCKYVASEKAPSDIDYWWQTSPNDSYWSGVSKNQNIGGWMQLWVIVDESDANGKLDITISDMSKVSVEAIGGSGANQMYQIHFKKAGDVTLTFKATYNPSLTKTVTFSITCANHKFNISKYGYIGADGHGHICDTCKEVQKVIKHTSSGSATYESGELCSECGYEMGPKKPYTIDKEVLISKINEAKKLDLSNMSEASANALLNQINQAQKVYDKKYPTQQEVNDAMIALNKAIINLKENTDYISIEMVQNKINYIETMDASLYTKTTYQALMKVVDEVQSIIDKDYVENEEVEAAYQKLIKAVNSLGKEIVLPFEDVKAKDWFYTSVKDAYRLNLMGKLKEVGGIHFFGPDVSISRGMVATVLYRMNGTIPTTFIPYFSDVTNPNLWYSTAITWANKQKVVSGYKDGRFGPDDNITRQDLAIMLRNFAQSKGIKTSKVSDLTDFMDDEKVVSYAKSAVAWCVENKIMSGSKQSDGLYLNPTKKASRAECAKMFSLLDALIKNSK